MARYKDLTHYRSELEKTEIQTRTDYLMAVKHAHIEDTSPLPNMPSLRALIFAQVLGLAQSVVTCSRCGEMFEPAYKRTRKRWLWRQQKKNGCCECENTQQSMTLGTALAGLPTRLWLQYFDVMVMWVFDYPRLIMLREAKPLAHSTLDGWISFFQRKAAIYAQASLSSLGFWPNKKSKLPKQQKKKTDKKKGRNARVKAKAAQLRKKAGARPLTKADLAKFKWIVQVDEAHLNKKKPGKLVRSTRPQRDQVWVWGAMLQDRNDIFLFRVLEHPTDAFEGKPRGHTEMLTNLHFLGLQKKTILVSDGWKATVSAVKSFRQAKRWTLRDFHHEIVVHSAGEVVNPRGFTTNGIENVWSVVKRWIRRRCGGRMPSHSDREKWRLLLAEFQFRKMASKGSTMDSGHTYFVPFAEFVKALQ
jgi:hypothetical protein